MLNEDLSLFGRVVICLFSLLAETFDSDFIAGVHFILSSVNHGSHGMRPRRDTADMRDITDLYGFHCVCF